VNIEKIFRNIPVLSEISLDTVLFESKYPVMFTCKNGNDVYLFICCLVNASIAKWIGTKTSYETLIELLKNRVTIQDAFLSVVDEKLVITYDGNNVDCNVVQSKKIPRELLPTDGEYMDAEDDEYAEEIAVFKSRSENMEYKIQPRISSLLSLKYQTSVTLTDDYFNVDLGVMDEMKLSIGEISNQWAVFA